MERFYLTRAYLTRAFSHSQGQVETVAGLFSKVGFEPNAVVVETLLTVAERLSLTTRYSFVSENRIGTAFSLALSALSVGGLGSVRFLFSFSA